MIYLRHLAVCIACTWCVAASAVGQAKAATSPFFQEASDCAAAFKARVEERLTQPPSERRDQAILQDTELGFVYVGIAYKNGLRNPEADQMLKASEKRWAPLGKAEKARTLSLCTARAQKLMKDVSSLERYIVQKRAKSRVAKLLQKGRN